MRRSESSASQPFFRQQLAQRLARKLTPSRGMNPPFETIVVRGAQVRWLGKVVARSEPEALDRDRKSREHRTLRRMTAKHSRFELPLRGTQDPGDFRRFRRQEIARHHFGSARMVGSEFKPTSDRF